MALLSKNESHFEHALRLTRALKDWEEPYMDSKVMFDILYNEITAEEDDPNLAADDSQTVVGDFSADDRMLGEELEVPLGGHYTNDEIREKIIDLLTKGGFKPAVAQVPWSPTSEACSL